MPVSSAGGSGVSGVSAFFYCGDLVDSSLMSSAAKVGGQPYLDDFSQHGCPEQVAGEAKNVGVIMMA